MSGLFAVAAPFGLIEVNKAVTGSSATDIVDATSTGINATVMVHRMEINEHAGSTPNLTVDLYDGSNTRYLGDDAGSTWNAKAVTAKQSVRFNGEIIVPLGSKLRVTSSDAAGKFHVHCVLIRTTAN